MKQKGKESVYFWALSLGISFLYLLIMNKTLPFLYSGENEVYRFDPTAFTLSLEPLGPKHRVDTFFTSYHQYLLGFNFSPEGVKKYLHYIFLLGCGIYFQTYISKKNIQASIFFLFLVLLSPLVLIHSTWVGFPDSFTLFFSFSLISYLQNSERLGRFKIWMFIMILLPGFMNHFFQFAILSFELIALEFLIRGKWDREILKAYFIILISSKIISGILFLIHGLEGGEEEIRILSSIPFNDLINYTVMNFLIGFYSLFGPMLPIILLIIFLDRNRVYYLVLFAINFSITCITLDTTRVFSILNTPPLLLLLLHSDFPKFTNERRDGKLEKILLPGMMVLSIVLALSFPPIYKWAGKIYTLNPILSNFHK